MFDDFHRDAEEVYNTCCDLPKMFERVAPYYPDARMPRQDLTARAPRAPHPSRHRRTPRRPSCRRRANTSMYTLLSF